MGLSAAPSSSCSTAASATTSQWSERKYRAVAPKISVLDPAVGFEAAQPGAGRLPGIDAEIGLHVVRIGDRHRGASERHEGLAAAQRHVGTEIGDPAVMSANRAPDISG